MGKKDKALEDAMKKAAAKANNDNHDEDKDKVDDVEEVSGPTKDEWKVAMERLKIAINNKSIDYYHKRDLIQQVRARFNNKERTQALYDLIMTL